MNSRLPVLQKKSKTSEAPTKTKWSTHEDEQHTNQWLKYKRWEPGEYPAETCIKYEFPPQK